MALLLLSAAPAYGETLDENILEEINRRHSPLCDTFNGILSERTQLVLVPLVAGGLGRDGKFLFSVAAAEGMGYFLSWGMKEVVRRQRPYENLYDIRTPQGKEDSSGFPSTHAAIAFAGAAAIAERNPNWAIPAYTWATLVAYSRVYNGLHYPSDVLAGAAVGLGAAKISSSLFGKNGFGWSFTF